MQNPQRYSGPELGPLLAQVRDELGEDATILEANRLRDGGIGGFFTKEKFEVVAAPADGEGPDGGVDDGTDTERAAAGDHLDQLLHRAERVNLDEQWVSQPGFADAMAAAAASAANGDQPAERAVPAEPAEPARGSADRFGAVLQAALAGSTPPERVEAPSPPAPAAAPTPPTPPIPPAPPVVEAAEAPSPARKAASWAGVPGGGFWANLDRFEGRIDEVPLVADITCIVGPIDDAVAVARSVAGLTGIDLGDLVVFTDHRRVEGIPPWQLVDRRDELTDRIRYWRETGRRALVVVDLEPGERALERAGRTVEITRADLTRLVTPDLDQPAELAATLRGVGPVVAIDVSRPPRPEALIEAVERGVRIGTVCGRPLTAMLLAGLAASVDRTHG